MGIAALFLIVILVLIFFILRIPKLTIAKKILIVVSVLLLCIIIMAVIFITGFERGRMPKREEIQSVQENFDTIKKTDTNAVAEDTNNVEGNHESPKTLFSIEGNYEFKKGNSTCKMNLTLYYQKNQLKYKLETDSHEFSDDAGIELNEKKDGYYIIFKNIEWSEYLGGLDNEGEPLDKDLPLPQNVSGTLYKDEIIIQNYGNSMNYYVVFEECGEKYIELVKK